MNRQVSSIFPPNVSGNLDRLFACRQETRLDAARPERRHGKVRNLRHRRHEVQVQEEPQVLFGQLFEVRQEERQEEEGEGELGDGRGQLPVWRGKHLEFQLRGGRRAQGGSFEMEREYILFSISRNHIGIIHIYGNNAF